MANRYRTDLLKFALPLVLAAFGVYFFWGLWSTTEPPVEQEVEPTQSRVITKRELQAFSLLKKADLQVDVGTAEATSSSAPTVEELEERYLLVKVKRGGEVKREMVAPREATSLLRDAVAVGIQPTSATSIGGRLQVGDMVDVVATGIKDRETPVMTFDNLMVLNVVTEAKTGDKASGIPVGITLAIPRGRRDEFAAATAGGAFVVTRRISAVN